MTRDDEAPGAGPVYLSQVPRARARARICLALAREAFEYGERRAAAQLLVADLVRVAAQAVVTGGLLAAVAALDAVVGSCDQLGQPVPDPPRVTSAAGHVVEEDER